MIPGPAFGMTDGCYFRVAYGALQKETVAEGIGRLVTDSGRSWNLPKSTGDQEAKSIVGLVFFKTLPSLIS